MGSEVEVSKFVMVENCAVADRASVDLQVTSLKWDLAFDPHKQTNSHVERYLLSLR